MVGSRAHAAIKLHDHRGRKQHKAGNPPAVSIWFPNFKIGWEIIGGKYIVRVTSVFFYNLLPGLLYVRGTLLSCYPKSSSLVLRLTSRKTLFTSGAKRKFSSWTKEVESQWSFPLAFDFSLLSRWRLWLLTLSAQFWSNAGMRSSCADFDACPHTWSEWPAFWDVDVWVCFQLS